MKTNSLFLLLLLASILFFQSCGNPQDDLINQVENLQYVKDLPKGIANLSPEKRAKRDTIFLKLKSLAIYKDLVENKDFKEQHLKVLEALGVGMSRTKKDRYTDLPQSLIDEALKTNESESFWKYCMNLYNTGGLPKEIVQAFYFCKDEFGLSAVKGKVEYDSESGKVIAKGFNLSPAFAVFDPANSYYLEEYWKAIELGLNTWRPLEKDESESDFLFPQLISKNAFLAYTKEINPNLSLFKTHTVTKDGNSSTDTHSNFIPGLQPVDVYGNFEKRGFTTEESISPDGSTWASSLTDNGIQYDVQTFCQNGVEEITEIRLSATRLEPQYNSVSAMKQFLKYGCSMQYKGYDIAKVNAFIDENYFNDKASIVISGVKFTIFAPTEFNRMITIVAD